jgi:peptidoglycan/LPS O-acetylase OafA/YrhL
MTLLAHSSNLLRLEPLSTFRHGFWLGVDLFMLISGWLLGGQLLREAKSGTLNPARFYMKRWMRTLPPYYAMLLVLYLGSGPQFGGPLPWSVIGTHVLFLQEYVGDNHFMVSWSLCVEEHFYLVLPLLVWALARRPRLSTLVTLVVATEVVSIAGRILTYSPAVDIPYMTHIRWHGLFVGMGLAWVHTNRPRVWHGIGLTATWLAPVGVIATLAVMASIPPPPNPWMYVGAATVGTWALALIFVPCVHESSALSRITFPGLKYMGELTYAIYLTHDVLPRWLVDAGGKIASAGGVAWRLTLIVAASVALHHVVERPALTIRDRILARWRVKPASAVAPVL